MNHPSQPSETKNRRFQDSIGESIMTYRTFLFWVLLAAAVLAGCSHRPKELPQCYPCSVTILLNGEVLPNATATLVPIGGGKKYVSSGKVDSTGTAVISTNCANYKEAGAPAGDYKLIVTVPPARGKTLSPEEKREMTPQELSSWAMKNKRNTQDMNPVPKAFRTVKDSPVTISVTQTQENVTKIDLASP